jgi:long-chain acyl-CoA synthetase
MFQLANVADFLPVAELDHTISFLPLCHIAERMATVFNQLKLGVVVHFPESSGTVFNDLREVAPHMLFAPPRFWEKMHSQIELAMRDAMPLARRIYGWALADGGAIVQAAMAGRSASRLARWRFRLLHILALQNVRKFLGLQNIKVAVTGAAPVPPALLKWYMATGINLLEAYGMTETTGYCTATPADRIRIGYAGVNAAVPNCRSVRGRSLGARAACVPGLLAHAGENRGGDWRRWLAAHRGLRRARCRRLSAHQGSAQGHHHHVGRQERHPQHHRERPQVQPLYRRCHGGRRRQKYLTCLVMIDQDNVAKFAQDRQVPYTDFRSLTQTLEVQALVRAEIEAINAKLARVEQIKDFRVIEDLLTAEDELTPTMKLKRRAVAKKYAHLIETMYRN